MGLSRSDVYIGNIMKWPTQEEIQLCLTYLISQVEIVQPKVIVALGATAVHGLLGYALQCRMLETLVYFSPNSFAS